MVKERAGVSPGVIIVAGCLIAMIAFGVRSTMGFFVEPMTEARGWGREEFGFAMALQNLLWGMAQPFAGLLADRHGPFRVIVFGAFIYAGGAVMMAFSGNLPMLYLGGGILMGAGIAATSFSIMMATFARVVPPEKRSWSFGLATAASSLGQFLFAPLGQGFIAAWGWQNALLVLAVFAGSIAVLAIPFKMSGKPSGTPAAEAEAEDMGIGRTLMKAFGHPSYVLLVAGFFVCGFHLAFITVHLPPYLTGQGISPALAGWAIGLIGLFNVIGSYVSGIYGGKHSKRYGLAMIYFARAVAIYLFIALPLTPVTTLVFTATMGLLWLSTVPLTMGLVVVMFGTRYMATLYGFVFLSHQIGSFLGVWLGGRFYDQFGNYDIIWWASIALGIASGLVHLPIREKVVREFAAG